MTITKTVVTEKTLQAPHIRRINADLYLELPDGPLSRDWWLWVKDKDADDWEPVSLDRVEALCLRAYLPDVPPDHAHVEATETARRELNERRAAKGLPPIRYPGPATEPDA